jgi:hypothetical protein
VTKGARTPGFIKNQAITGLFTTTWRLDALKLKKKPGGLEPFVTKWRLGASSWRLSSLT